MTKKIIGIGNAIIDILCKVDEEFLLDHSLIKGSMSLIDEDIAEKLSQLNAEKITSGGSVGNTIATLGQLGCEAAFIGKVAHDEFGRKFIGEIGKSGVEFIGENSYKKLSAKSFVLVTPDAERTMCTFLGCASEIDQASIKEENFRDSSFLYLEGYLWDADTTTAALKKSIELAKNNGAKVAFSLSDPFCVSRHKQDFIELVSNKLDILFANEDEIVELTEAENFSPEIVQDFFTKNPHLTIIITRSEKGCIVINSSNSFAVTAEKIEKLIDTTGAGDAFAAGFLYGMINDFDLQKCAAFGNKLAGKIIQKFGARFESEEIKNTRHP